MYQPSRLSFKNIAVFEKRFVPSIDIAFCVVSKMMFLDKINIDGSIDMTKTGGMNKYELWSYIYYLYYYNNSSLDIFAAMKNPKDGKANALLMYSVVKKTVENQFVSQDDILAFDVNTLAYFINKVIVEYGDDLVNPIVQYLKRIMNSPRAIEQIKQFTVKTGQNPGNVVVVTDPKEIENAAMKVSLILKEN